MFEHKELFRTYIEQKGVGSQDRVSDSVKSYIYYINCVSKHSGINIGPATLASDIDVQNLVQKIKGKVSKKTIQNYKSAMNQYVSMVREHGLQ